MVQAAESEETLEKLLEASKRPEGRSHLATAGTLVTLLNRLCNTLPDDTLLIFRILRNLCAGETDNQNAFLNNGGSVVVQAILGLSIATSEIRRVGLQLLGNVALAGEEHRAAVWAAFFPVRFLEIAEFRESEVCDALCMVLDTCCSSDGGRRRLEELCDDEKGMVTAAFTGGYEEEWLEWLLTKICIEEPYFLHLFEKIGPTSDDYGRADKKYTLFSSTQAFLLKLLSKCLSERPGDISMSNDFALSILKIFKEATNVTDFFSRGTSALPTGFPTIDVLGYSLMILRDSCAWEDHSLAALEAPVESLLSAGLMEVVLISLEELEPPSIVRRSVVTEGKKMCPYRGFRRDLVSVIGNCLHRRKEVQDKIRMRNAIPLLLQQCVLDDENPFLREWGLLTARNLLEGNFENQQYVAELQLLDSVNTPEISGLGLKVEVDKSTNRAKLVNIS
ncbi:LOW QUALITY PROTEIN: ataxin-10 [Phalaenopsis equestris]|uniref:LOW QUALITY PROTEIN: ataxin-10 n=1 Tax=Phalaenopsis equestris TaxID=78828 RepID=UPI0009E4EB4A|nr:LOW QUALITY PROTEIN: ataxin-10 [Phalaenopsis equestris]